MASSSSLNGFSAGVNAKDNNVPVGHLDYSYISKCDNAKEVEEIIKVLRSGSVGYYPDLVEYAEAKLKELDPKSLVLRKIIPAQRSSDLDKDTQKTITDELQDWMNKMNSKDSKLLENMDNKSEMVNGENLPPVRSTMKATKIETNKETKTDTSDKTRSAMPREYHEWDKFDIEKELIQVDKKEPAWMSKDVKHKNVFEAKLFSTKDLKPEEREERALKEKEKGNEAFKAMDFEEAIVYYTNSLSYEPLAASYNNRAAANLKIKKYAEVIDDCNKVLELEPDNLKAYLRRGMAYKALKHYEEASEDFNTMLSIDGNNKRAKQLVAEIEKIKRPSIEAEESEKCTPLENSTNEENGNKLSPEKGKVKMIDLDSTEESMTEVPQKTVMGHEDEKFENIQSTKKGQRVNIVEVESAEDPGGEVPQSVDKETENEIFGNAKSKKEGQWLKIEEIDSESDVMQSTHKGIVDNKVKTDSDVEKEVTEDPWKLRASQVPGDTPAKDVEISTKGGTLVNESELSSDVVKEIDSTATATTTHDDNALVKPVEVPAKDEAKVVLEIPPKVKSFMDEGNQLYQTGHYVEALEKFSKSVDQLWKDREAYSSAVASSLNNKAACYHKMGDCKQCVAECDKSLEIISDNIKVLTRRGKAYETMEKYVEAFSDFNRVRLLVGPNKLAQENCARVIKHLEALHGVSWRKTIFKMNSSDASTSQDIPNTEKNEKASDGAHVSVSKESETTASVDMQQEVSTKSGPAKQPECEEKVEHKEEFEKKKRQEQYLKLKGSGNVLVKQGKHEEAINHYTDCVKLCPEEIVGYTNRALCYLHINKYELAETDCTAALNIQADNIKALFRRAKARKGMKLYRESSEDLITVLKLDNKNIFANTELQEILQCLRNEKKNTEKSTGAKRKRIKIKDIVGDDDKTSSPVVTNASGLEHDKLNESKVVKGEKMQQSQSSENIAKEKNSLPDLKKVSPAVEKDVKSSSSKRNKHAKNVKKDSHKDSSKNNCTNTVPVKVPVAEDITVPMAEDIPIPVAEDIPIPVAEDIPIPVAEDIPIPVAEDIAIPVAEDIPIPVAEDMAMPVAEDIPIPVAEDIAISVAEDIPIPVAEDIAISVAEDIAVSEKEEESKVPKKECVQSSNVRKEQNTVLVKYNVKTAFQFFQTWKDVKNGNTTCFLNILKQINLADVRKVISNRLDADMVHTMFQALHLELKSKGDMKFVYNFLQRLHSVERFEMTLMFQSKKEKQALSQLFDDLVEQCKQQTQIRSEDIAKLRKRYKV